MVTAKAGEGLKTKVNGDEGYPYCVSFFKKAVVKHHDFGWGISKSKPVFIRQANLINIATSLENIDFK